MKQFFVDGFFHADPHPGNLFVRLEPELPATYVNGHNGVHPPGAHHGNRVMVDGYLLGDAEAHAVAPGRPFTLIFVDFGMVGALTPQMMDVVRGGVVGLATSDAERIVEVLEKLNMILPGADRRPIVQAVQIMLRHSFNRTMREMSNIDVEAIFDETKDIIYDLPFQIPQNLLYFGRALSMVAGLATEICPDINLFHELRPFARMLLDQERRSGNWPEQVQKELRELGQILLTLPRQMDAYYKSANRGELSSRMDMSRLERGMRRVERSTDRLAGGMMATGLFLGGVQLRTRGLEREASRAWWAAAAAALWAVWPRGER
jgi:predicted unusual protein kinase regulating ubiquinone biosynthesis (AarF/ABC1/UbiB family)